jgi:hypothetical protein
MDWRGDEKAGTNIRGPDEDDEARVSVVLDLGQLRRAALLELLALRPAPPAASLHHQRAPRRLPPRRRPDKRVDGRELSDARRRRPQRHAGHHLHGDASAWHCEPRRDREKIRKWIIW